MMARWARAQNSLAPEGNFRARRKAERAARFRSAGQPSGSAIDATRQSQVATLPEFSVAELVKNLPVVSSEPAEEDEDEEEGGVLLKTHPEMTYRPKP